MNSVNDETRKAIKLSRVDAVKLVTAEMMDLAASDLSLCRKAVDAARENFTGYVVSCARAEYGGMLNTLKVVADRIRKMHAVCTYRVYTSGEDSGDTAEVVFSDHPQTYEARTRVTVTVELSARALELRSLWLSELEGLRDARDRDTRVGAMTSEARKILIQSALDSTDEGVAVIAAIRALAKVIKDKT